MIQRLRKKWLLPSVFFLWLFGCSDGPLAPDPHIVEANGKRFISLREFIKAFNDQYQQWASSDENPSVDQRKVLELKKAFLDRFIEEKLILKKARELGIEVTKEELKAKIDSLRRDYPGSQMEEMSKKGLINMERLKEGIQKDLLMRKVIDRFLAKKVAVSQEEAMDHFETRRELYHVPKQVRASQIVVATDMKARRLLSQLRDGGHFAKLARENSLSPDSRNGGRLGFFSPGQMPKEFDEVVFSLPVNQWSHVTGSP